MLGGTRTDDPERSASTIMQNENGSTASRNEVAVDKPEPPQVLDWDGPDDPDNTQNVCINSLYLSCCVVLMVLCLVF